MKIKSTIKKSIIKLYKILVMAYYYAMTKILCVKNNKVVIVLSRGTELQGNLKYIYQSLSNQDKKLKVHFIYTENKMNLKLFYELTILSNARYLILDDYYLPVYLIKPNKSMKIIQLWHAAGAFKKFGYSTIGTRFGPKNVYLELIPIHSNYDFVYVSTKNVIPYYAEAFNMSPSKIFPLGIPRVDLFNNDSDVRTSMKRILEDFPIIKDDTKVNILIAPTYRAKGKQKESGFNIVDIIHNITEKLKSNVRIVLKPHPYMDQNELKKIEKHKNVVLVYKHSINEWMLFADAFITDYSSSIFDYSLLKKPLAHFVPDINDYEKNRGLYQKIKDVSDGIVIMEQEKLVRWINSRKKNEYYDTTRMIRVNFDNTKNVSDEIVKHFMNN